MAFTTDIQRFENSIVTRMRNGLAQARLAHAKNRLYRQTVKELSALTTRELDDLGIHRSQIEAVARTTTDAM